jgi:hypothetical protein
VREVKEDLERFRQGRPVHARPHSAWYAARKFIARNWLAVSATGLSVVALSTLTIVSVNESARARAQALRAERVAEFVKHTFVSATSYWDSPLRGKRDAIQFSDILDSACERVGKALGDDPAAEADLRDTLGFTHAVLGEPAKGKHNCFLGSKRSRGFAGARPRLRPVFTGIFAIPAAFRTATPTRSPHAAKPWRFGASVTPAHSAVCARHRLHGGKRRRTFAGGRKDVPGGAAIPPPQRPPVFPNQ